MSDVPYPAGRTALLLVDPYNDFLSDGGKLWPRVAATAAAAGLHERLKSVIAVARRAGFPVFIVPHHRYALGDILGWTHPSPYLAASAQAVIFAKGEWGGEWHRDFAPQPGDVIIQEHWGSSGFANTDLDMQLKQRGVSHVILVGLVANTCIEGTGRFASELGYHVTLVTDATAAFSDEAMHAAHAINGPTYAHAIVTAQELTGQLNAA